MLNILCQYIASQWASDTGQTSCNRAGFGARKFSYFTTPPQYSEEDMRQNSMLQYLLLERSEARPRLL